MLAITFFVDVFYQFSSVQSLSHVQLFVIPWTAACQASLPITNFWNSLKLMYIASSQWCHPAISNSVIPFSSCLQSFPASGSFPRSQFFASGGQSIRVSALASVLPKNMLDRFPLGLTGFDLLAVQGTLKSLLQYHSSKPSILWHSVFFIVQLPHPYMTTGKS